MKKVYSIALLAIIMIVCLQGYNVHLQYQKYKLKCIDEINDMLYNQLTRNTMIEQKVKIILTKMENTIFDIKYSMQQTKFKRKI